MKNILLVCIVVVAGYVVMKDILKSGIEPLYEKPYVAVYGKTTCG